MQLILMCPLGYLKPCPGRRDNSLKRLWLSIRPGATVRPCTSIDDIARAGTPVLVSRPRWCAIPFRSGRAFDLSHERNEPSDPIFQREWSTERGQARLGGRELPRPTTKGSAAPGSYGSRRLLADAEQESLIDR